MCLPLLPSNEGGTGSGRTVVLLVQSDFENDRNRVLKKKLFVETLKKIGYNVSGSDLSGDNFDWMFDDDNLKGFCSWFCSNVDQSNFIHPSDVEKFTKLSSSGAALELEDVNKLLAHEQSLLVQRDEMDFYDDDFEDVNKNSEGRMNHVLNKIKSSKDILSENKKKKMLLKKQHEILNKQLKQMKDENSVNETLVGSLGKQVDCSLLRLKKEDEDWSLVSDKLCLSVQNVMNFYESFMKRSEVVGDSTELSPVLVETGQVNNDFASLQNFDVILKHNNEFLQLVEDYMRFQSQINNADDESWDSSSSIVNSNKSSGGLSDSACLSVTDLTSANDDEDDVCKPAALESIKKYSFSREWMDDIFMIQRCLQPTELSYIMADVNKSMVSIECDFLEKYISDFKSSPSSSALPSNNSNYHQHNIKLMSETLSRIYNSELPPILQKVAQYKMLDVVATNYDEKLQKQEEVLTFLDGVLSQFMKHESLNCCLHAVLHLEQKDHRNLKMMLMAIELLLEEVVYKSAIRQAKLKDMLSSSSSHSSSTEHDGNMILPTESYLGPVSNMLNTIRTNYADQMKDADNNDDSVGGGELFVTVSMLLDQARRLMRMKLSKESTTALNRCLAHQNAGLLCKQQQETVKLFPLDDSKSNNPINRDLGSDLTSKLLPQSIIAKMIELDDISQKVKLSFTPIVQEIEDKKKMLSGDELALYGRNLFIDFFLHENRLKKRVKELFDRTRLMQ
ncbi:hypothetical protein HELRODRAFT_174733 [Helobdella robusta]|uniref:HAUS augmin-like complex subunit 3 N-terminal domain-containing protein n=1 Tax=Helobdella robusta TaxID=6412 RepID=T1F8F1_HELRO|nr:hypothetical protein HELRODRAFT_174733 [Helobdella robusta]ESO01749.1 hypothetical protein HELRODRAFT_174733 [Helobdella robusta]